MENLLKEKIFSINKVNKEEKNKKNEISETNSESNLNINEEENESENEEISDNNSDKKIYKRDIITNPDENEINKILEKEDFINRCLDSKDPKDLVNLLKYFGNDINFEVEDINLLKKYQQYLKIDLENIEDNNEEESNDLNNDISEDNENDNNNINEDENINNEKTFFPYLIAPAGTQINFSPFYTSKILLNKINK